MCCIIWDENTTLIFLHYPPKAKTLSGAFQERQPRKEGQSQLQDHLHFPYVSPHWAMPQPPVQEEQLCQILLKLVMDLQVLPCVIVPAKR